MHERNEQLREALVQIDDPWNAARTERTLPGVHQRARRVRTARTLAAVAGIGIAAAAGWALWSQPQRSQLAAAPSQAARHMQFEDGSQLEFLDPSARIVVDEVTPERISVRLLSGGARLDVVPRKERAFRVLCGEVSVEVLGTAFEVTRAGERTRVSVIRGRVAVHWPQGSTQLSAGEVGWFPKQPAAEPSQPSAAGAESGQRIAAEPSMRVEKSRKATHRGHASPHDSSWQSQAERGDFKRAYELMSEAPEPVADDVQELLLAADAARLSGHPAQALPFLRRVIELHPRDPRASLAAFTLAGVLLNQLERPHEAEAAYARARSLALSPALAQDALARQVEAAERAGDADRMRELAREYLQRYPDGRRVEWVRQLSGL